jgi:hypothetical protein
LRPGSPAFESGWFFVSTLVAFNMSMDHSIVSIALKLKPLEVIWSSLTGN